MSRFSATERFPLFVSLSPFIGPDPIIPGRPDSFSLVWRLFSSVGGDGVSRDQVEAAARVILHCPEKEGDHARCFYLRVSTLDQTTVN
jgi:hypothetical protein